MSTFKIAKTEYKPVPTGEYPCTIENVEREDGDYGPQAKFTFALDNMDGKTLHAWASAKYGSKTKLYSWVVAILGRVPDEFDADELIGQPCTLVVVTKTKDDGTPFNRVDSILPARAADNAAKLEQAAQLAKVDEVPF